MSDLPPRRAHALFDAALCEDQPLEFYTRYGELDLEGRLLIRCDQHLADGNLEAALADLLALVPRAPWLQDVCAGRMQRLLTWRRQQEAVAERELRAADAATAEAITPATALAMLAKVLQQPSLAVVLQGISPLLLLEGLLQQAVWDAQVWLDPMAVSDPSDSRLPEAAAWLDGLSCDRQPAPLRPLRLRGAAKQLRQQGLAWVPRCQPLEPWSLSQQEAAQPADWPRCLQRSQSRRLLQAAAPLPAAASTDPSPAALSLSLVLTISEGDAAEAIRSSIASLAAAELPSLRDLIVVHPPLRPAQQNGLSAALSELPAALQQPLQQLELPRRSGAALACNRALASSRGDQLLLLRAGVRLEPGVVSSLRQALSDNGCRAVQPGLRSPEGRVVGLGYGFAAAGQPGQPVLHGCPWPEHLPETSRQQAVLGSCWLLRRQEVLAVGGWDPQYRDGLDDQDLCLRLIHRFGGHCLVCTAASASAPLQQGEELKSDDRDWNRCVFQQHGLATEDLADVARSYGHALVGLLPEADPPASASLQRQLGVLAAEPAADRGPTLLSVG